VSGTTEGDWSRRAGEEGWPYLPEPESDQESEGGKGGVKKREFYDDAEKQLVEAYERDESAGR